MVFWSLTSRPKQWLFWLGSFLILFLLLQAQTDPVGSAPSQTKPADSLLTYIDGFAAYAETDGGEAGSLYIVTSSANGGNGTLRNALSRGDRYIMFDPSLNGATINLRDDIIVSNNNITIDGRGVDITISGATLKFEGDNYILAYLNFDQNIDNEESDSVTFRNAPVGGQRFFVYKSSFDHASDGLIDIIWNQGQDVYGTIKLSAFANHDKTILIDSNLLEREGGTYYITITENYFLNTTQRLPLSRRAYVHFYNNLIERWGSAEGEGGGAYAGTDAQYLTESNIAIPYQLGDPHHLGGTVTRPLLKAFAPHFESTGDVRSRNNWLKNGAYDVQKNANQVEDPPYEYIVQPATAELEAFVRTYAGSGQVDLPNTPTPSITPSATPTRVVDPNVTPSPTIEIEPTQTEPLNLFSAKVNFQAADSGVPTGYYRDFGEPFGLRDLSRQGNGLLFGWVIPGTNTPLDLVGNGRLRWRNSDHRLDTLMHMQYSGSAERGVAVPGAWEMAVPNGDYVVIVSTGDAKSQVTLEIDRISIEGVPVIVDFTRPGVETPEGSPTRHMVKKVTVTVRDGRLTLDPSGGVNTKINYVEIVSTDIFEPDMTVTPSPTSSIPLTTSTPTPPSSPSATPTAGPSGTPVDPLMDVIAYMPIIGNR